MKITTVTGTYCDNEHDEQEVPAESTRTITVNGRTYKIDLCGPCTIGFDTAFGVIIKHARIVTRKPTPVTKRRDRSKREADRAVRDFWRANPEIHDGPFQERGRIPDDVTAAYRASISNA